MGHHKMMPGARLSRSCAFASAAEAKIRSRRASKHLALGVVVVAALVVAPGQPSQRTPCCRTDTRSSTFFFVKRSTLPHPPLHPPLQHTTAPNKDGAGDRGGLRDARHSGGRRREQQSQQQQQQQQLTSVLRLPGQQKRELGPGELGAHPPQPRRCL